MCFRQLGPCPGASTFKWCHQAFLGRSSELNLFSSCSLGTELGLQAFLLSRPLYDRRLGLQRVRKYRPVRKCYAVLAVELQLPLGMILSVQVISLSLLLAWLPRLYPLPSSAGCSGRQAAAIVSSHSAHPSSAVMTSSWSSVKGLLGRQH